MTTEILVPPRHRDPWNKGRLISQKRPLKPKDVWTIRVRLKMEERRRDLAMFNLAIDSKLRGCDLVRLRIDDVFVGGRVRDRAMVIQKKTGRPVQFEITEQTRAAIGDWLTVLSTRRGRYLFPSGFRRFDHFLPQRKDYRSSSIGTFPAAYQQSDFCSSCKMRDDLLRHKLMGLHVVAIIAVDQQLYTGVLVFADQIDGFGDGADEAP